MIENGKKKRLQKIKNTKFNLFQVFDKLILVRPNCLLKFTQKDTIIFLVRDQLSLLLNNFK